MVDTKEEVCVLIFVLLIFYFFSKWRLRMGVCFYFFALAPPQYIIAFHYFSLQLTIALVKAEMEKTLHWLAPIATNTTKYVK
jgi:hypothetical protein